MAMGEMVRQQWEKVDRYTIQIRLLASTYNGMQYTRLLLISESELYRK